MAVAIETPAAQRAAHALAILTLINLFNYLDRWVVAPVVESIKKSELHLSDTQIGFIATGFIIVYTLTSPLFGAFGDRRVAMFQTATPSAISGGRATTASKKIRLNTFTQNHAR
ncbi:MAG: transporter, Spinster family, sphingosine-phosphate transporter [Thermoanaerobaculia bacterium]|jgi:MFS family permease|nr:transporter, Spinster family, sphingosine-phosphate transporter [Thermoanaerobaculia bacterium]